MYLISTRIAAGSWERDLESVVMSDLKANGVQPAAVATPLFAAPPPEKGGVAKVAVLCAVIAVLASVGALLLPKHGRQQQTVTPRGTILPLDPYAANLQVSDLAMSEAQSFSGGKSTYIDGHIRNTGSKIVSGITVQVLFRNDVGLAPQVETLPLSLIRTHEPYVDTEPVSAAPLKPGDDREFRLIFEDINSNWNVQMPEIRVTGTTAK